MKDSNIVKELSFAFSLKIISLAKVLTSSRDYVIANQILKSGTSIGANIEESTAGQSRKDFISKLSIASKEAHETRYWLRLLDRSKEFDIDVKTYLDDIESIIRVLTKIIKTTQQRDG